MMRPNPDLAQLRTFLALAQTGSFSEAARRLCRTQSAVSHAIRKLEETSGVELVARTGRRFALTDEGRRLQQACEDAFAAFDEAFEDLNGNRKLLLGRVRLGSTVEFGCSILMKHIRPFMKAHPEIEIDFQMSHDLLTPLLKDDLDIAIDCGEHHLPELRKTPLFRETYAVVCSPGFQKESKVRVPAHLGRCTVLSLDKEGGWWDRFIRSLSPEERPELRHIIAVNHIRAMITAATSGLGAAMVPHYSVLAEIAEGTLVRLFPKVEIAQDCFYIYQKERRAGLRKHRLLADYLRSIRPSEFGA
ncbi:MAG: LysR family transcriptional regulator [Acidobacteriota bacterium]|jgi:DNA-binding transcriptional LysR family regulator